MDKEIYLRCRFEGWGSSWQGKGMPTQHLGVWRILWSPIPQTKSYLFMETSMENHCRKKAHYVVPSTRNKALEALIDIILNLSIEIRTITTLKSVRRAGRWRGKVCSGIIRFNFSCSPFSTHWVHTLGLVLHWQIYNEASTKIILKIRPPLVWLWTPKMRIVCWFVN